MQLPHSPRGGHLITGVLASLSIISQMFAASKIPRGTLNVDRSLVRVGASSQLDWKIQYPSRFVDVDLVPKTQVKMRVRTLGGAFQSGATLLPLEGSWSKNNGAWATFFAGTGPSVLPTKVPVETTLNKGDIVKFRGRGASNAKGSSWFAYHQTGGTDKYVIVLKNGDSAPNQGTAKSFLAPYLDGMGRIKIGPQDLIILWELSTAAPGTTSFDMLDLVVLVSFEAA